MIFRKYFVHSLLALSVAAAVTPSAFAWKLPKRCDPTCAVFHSEFFGYYPTCWRKFPAGQPTCPQEAPLIVTELPKPKDVPESLKPKDAAMPAPKPVVPDPKK